MRAIRHHSFGGPDVLRLERLDDLRPAAGEVRIAVEAAGVHLLDTSLRAGEPGPFGVLELPLVPGREVAGRVDATGPDVDPAWLGRRVVAHLGAAHGGYAEQAVAPVAALIPIAGTTPAAHAVAMVGTGRTALGILAEAGLGADDIVLLPAAAGGLGTLLVQAAKRSGATVIGLAGGPDKAAVVERLGADLAVDYRDGAWADAVTGWLADRQVSVVLDGVGGAVGRRAFDLLAPGGRIVMFGYTSGTPTALTGTDLMARGLAASSALGPRMMARPGGIQALAVAAVADLEAGRWVPGITEFPLAEAAAAHAALAERATTGKVVLIP